MRDAIDWNQLFAETQHPCIPILPIPSEVDQAEFNVNIIATELKDLKDDQGVICFEKVMVLRMPQFDDDDGNSEDIGLFKW